MTSFQKTIKYIAIGLGVFLAISIVLALANIGEMIISFATGNRHTIDNRELINFEENYSEVKNIEIKDVVGQLDIKVGSDFRVEGQNVTEGFKAKVTKNGTLQVKEEGSGRIFNWFDNRSSNSKIVLYLPEDFKADKVSIEGGVSKTTIDYLHTKELKVSVGVGELYGNKIYAGEVDINGGVGNVTLRDVTLHDIDVDAGVGELYIQGDIFGYSRIRGGVGQVQIDLNGDPMDYKLDIDSGIGQVRVNGGKTSGGIYGNHDAEHEIKIDGGIGEIEVKFK